MLKSLICKLACPACMQTEAPLIARVFAEAAGGHIRDGILRCSACGAWYPIEDELLELVPAALIDDQDLRAFVQKFSDRLIACGADPAKAGGQKLDSNFDAQIKQRHHFDKYAGGEPGFADYTLTPFIRASSERAYSVWRQRLSPARSWMLDVGCGTANSSLAFAADHTVVGFDISKKMIRRDIDVARSRGFTETTFFVGDGANPPLRDQSFDYVHTVGALHHLPDPARTVKEIQRILVPGGLHFASENNRSMFRGIFDLLMKIHPLWNEEAGAEPTMSRKMFDDWCRALPVEITSQTSIFLPPYFLNLFTVDAAERLIHWSDRLFLRVPIMRSHGGILFVTIRKLPA